MEPLTTFEEMSIIAEEARNEFQSVMMYLALAGLVVSAVVLFVVKFFAPTWEQIRKYMKLPRIQQILVGFVVIGFVQYGATKSSFSFSGGIKQNEIQPSVATNDLVSIHWMRDTSGGIYVPTDATVYIDYKEWANTNATWQSLGQTTVGAWQYSTTLVNATNYAYSVWAYYIPPEPVHTNGVWIYKTLKDRNDKYPLPLRARIEINGKAISTPKEKRKDSGND